jgi:hypothetical protein
MVKRYVTICLVIDICSPCPTPEDNYSQECTQDLSFLSLEVHTLCSPLPRISNVPERHYVIGGWCLDQPRRQKRVWKHPSHIGV